MLQRAALVGLTAGVLLAGAAARAEEPPPAAAEQRPPERTLVLKGGARVTGAITTADGVTRVRMRSATLVAPEAQVDRIVDVEAKPAVETPGAPAARREELRLNPVLGYAFVKSRDFTFLDDAPRPAADFALLLPKLGLEVVLSVLPDATPEVVISEGTLPLLRDDLVKRETALATAYTASESFVGEVMGQKAMVVRAKVKPLLRDKEMLVRETADWKA
ncbi:MAG: hypothetical protein HY719_04270, partial [Planctomycetes bacterium]|nr:hypothetical protein [Planctomycetota bacterium]